MEKVIYRTSVCELLTVAFVILKLTNVINWSWWWVLAPLWIPLCLFIIIVIFAFIGIVSIAAIKAKN